MNRAVALLLAMLMLVSSLMFTLSSCTDDKEDDKENEGGGGTGQTETYSVTVSTKGGMTLSGLPVYIHEYEDGYIGELVDNGYAATDANGKASIKLPKGSYAAKIDLGLPEGYDAEGFYPFLTNELSITVSSSVISESSLVGVSYKLGDVMRDFTFNSTYLEKNDKGEVVTKDRVFTLSEELKNKEAVLINFWGTGCTWCITEFPLMQAAYEKYQDDLSIIALAPPEFYGDTQSAIESFQRSYGLTFDVALDDTGLYNAFGVTGLPTSVMIDRYGVVTILHAGAITSERVFDVIFDFFTADDYKQQLVNDFNDIVPKEKPDVTQPDSSVIADAFEKEGADLGNIEYRNDADDEFSWPFLDGKIGEGSNAVSCIYPSNSEKEGSYAQLLFDVDLKVGEALAFDYFASTEIGADILYVVVDGKDIYTISGESTDWQTCYAFVAEEAATYEVALVYMKDTSNNIGDDTVYLKDLRIVGEADVDSPTYIYRFAATNPDDYSVYQDYVDIFVGADGYYHVGSATGPILLANLMGFTRFSEDNTVYLMATELYEDKKITAEVYDKIVDYCSYASNASISGVSSVTPELVELLESIVYYYGDSSNDKDWLRLCCYYDAYGTDGKQLEDPIKGLALFSAYDVVESKYGSTDFPNSFTYDRVIMPRGLIAKFTPKTSGTYLITSNTRDENTGLDAECDAWIYTADGYDQRKPWLTYDNIDRFNTTDTANCYMIAYLEAGKDYYIDIAYYDTYGTGTIKYRVERLGGEGYYRFSLASPSFFTTLEDKNGDITGYIISGGIDVVLGSDGIWREKRTDGREGSILYADFSMIAPLFNHSLEDMIDLGGFDFSRTDNDQYILNYIASNGNDVEKCDKYLRELWGEDYEEYAEIYKVEEVYNAFLTGGKYHGDGENYTALARSFADQMIKAGKHPTLGNIAADDERIGCVIVTEELAQLLQLLMDKYTFMNGVEPNQTSVENSWAKLCYYHQYFSAATPK